MYIKKKRGKETERHRELGRIFFVTACVLPSCTYNFWVGYVHVCVGVLHYKLLVTNPGDYTLSIHNYHACHDSTECNDVFVRANNGEFEKVFSNNKNVWTWTSNYHRPAARPEFGAMKLNLKAGLNTFEISGY